MAIPTATTDLSSWKPQDQYVERLLDNAAYSAAHPDDTLIMAGPSRNPGATTGVSMLPIGMVQQFQIGQNVPVAPIPSIGSGRIFYTRSKAQIAWSMSRLWVNGRNLLRALYHNAVEAHGGGTLNLPEKFAKDDKLNNQFFANLDSELFAVPLGLACYFRDKSKNSIGAFYVESCMINSWNVGVAAGTNMIMTNVTGIADRIVPLTDGTYGISTDQGNLDLVNAFSTDAERTAIDNS